MTACLTNPNHNYIYITIFIPTLERYSTKRHNTVRKALCPGRIDEIHHAYTKAYHRMDSRKRTMYISKKEFTEWSKTARKKRKLCEESISAATYISKKSVPAVPFSLYLETAYQTPLLPAHLQDSLSVLNTLL